MSKIPYYFETPIPSYFIKNNWFKPEESGKHFKRMFFIQWCFSRCSIYKRTVFFLNRAIELEPYEFIFGRNICSKETGLSEQEIKTLINQLNTINSVPTLEKSTSKSTNKFSVYKWNTGHFNEITNQQNNQQPTSSQPAANHNLDKRSIDIYNGSIESERDAHNEKIIPISEESIEPKLIYKTRKAPHVGSTSIKAITHKLNESGYFVSEIESAIQTFNQKERTVGDIFSYIEKIILNERTKVKLEKKYESPRNRKFAGNYDPVERSKDELKRTAGVYAPNSERAYS